MSRDNIRLRRLEARNEPLFLKEMAAPMSSKVQYPENKGLSLNKDSVNRSGREVNAVGIATKSTIMSPVTKLSNQKCSGALNLILRGFIAPSRKLALLLLIISWLSLQVAALDYEMAEHAIIPRYPPAFHPPDVAPMPFFMANRVPRFAIGALTGVFLLISGILNGAARTLLGPLMGITSLLWFIMRNDPAVKPSLSFIMFGAWSLLTLMYLFVQCHRVVFHQLYILLTMAFAGGCMCIVALVQKSSISGGLVTAIPPCTAFSAYAVAFFFPSSRRLPEHVIV